MSFKELLFTFFASLGISVPALISGSIGGAVNRIENDKRSKGEIFSAIFIGGAVAGYLAPLAVRLINFYLFELGEGFLGAIGFIIGILSMHIVHLIQYVFHNKSDLVKLLKEFILFKNKKP